MELDTFLRVVNRDGGTKREKVSAARKGQAKHMSSLTRASKAPTQPDGKRWKETQKETESKHTGKEERVGFGSRDKRG